jgi:hypothetical protein
MYQDINIYENYVSVFEPGFVSPIADFGLMFYKYYLIDSAFIGDKWCYQISFIPKRKQERTFRGDFWVNDTTFAIVKIQLRMAKEVNINYINDFVADYEYTNGVTYNGTAGTDGQLVFSVPADAPDNLYYVCVNHSGMGTGGSLTSVINSENKAYVVQQDGDLYIWNGSAWESVGQIIGPTGPTGPSGGPTGPTGPIGPPAFTLSATEPASPSVGDVWFNTNTAVAVVWYEDADSAQWVEFAGQGLRGPAGATGATGPAGEDGTNIQMTSSAPSGASSGDLWYDTTDGKLYVYFQDSDSAQWVQVTT